MTDSLLILSIGPVQGFIAQARRAADLYAGSQLLTRLLGTAIEAVGEENVLYPRKAGTGGQQSLPNKLIARLPGEQAQALAEKAEKRIKAEWRQIADLAEGQLGKYVPPDEEWQQMWQEQLAQLPEIYWTITPWQEGQDYRQVYEQAGRDFDARKHLRNFGPIEERGRKCTICGERAALHQAGEMARDYWRAVAEQVDEAKLRPGGKEQLCAVCAVKRFGELGQERFPSVSEMAAVPFKKALLEQLQENELDQETHGRLIPALEQHTQALTSLGTPTVSRDVVPALADMPVSTIWRNFAEKILRYDGEWLFPETYARKLAETEQHSTKKRQKIRQAQRTAQEIIKIAGDLGLMPSRPTPYYAIMFADGDRMGKQIRTAASDGPERHSEISKALAEFAAQEVYSIVKKHDGRVVYAGGDDVVALFPITTVLAAADALRRAYAAQMTNLLVSPTMSAGIAIAHHLSPLGGVLRAARQAEHAAKERYGRNAIAVAFHKRGGAPVMMGAPWDFGDHLSTVDLLLDFQRRFVAANNRTSRDSGLSMGLAHTLLDEAHFLGKQVPRAARQAEVERLLYRAAPGHLPKEARLAQAHDLAKLLIQLAESIEQLEQQAERPPYLRKDGASVTGLMTVAYWLLLVRFIVQEVG